jgi:hypothetical protein
VLAGFDELLGFAQSLSVDEHNLLLFRCWVEEVAIHNERFKLLKYEPLKSMLIDQIDAGTVARFIERRKGCA